MSIEIIDLTQERCPMTLLKAKRASRGLKTEQSLCFLVSDKSSFLDMQSYFQGQNLSIRANTMSHLYQLTITKQ